MRFVNRNIELSRLDAQLELFLAGEWDNTCHLAILGLKRSTSFGLNQSERLPLT